MAEQPSLHSGESDVLIPFWESRFDEKAREFLALEKDWDSYGGERIERAPLAAARRFLEVALTDWQLVPTSDGGVQLEWHANGVEAEIAFGPDGEQTYE